MPYDRVIYPRYIPLSWRDANGAQNISLASPYDVFFILFHFLFKSGQDDFVKVKGTHFIYNGKPYYYAGTNLWYGCYIGSPGETGDRPRLLRELDSLHAIGLDNIENPGGLGSIQKKYVAYSRQYSVSRAT